MFPYGFMLSTVREIHCHDRWFFSKSMEECCLAVEKIMREIGLVQVKTMRFPADGCVDYGGWVMPLAWDPTDSLLEIVHFDGVQEKICSYRETPCSLMLYSRAIDVTAPVVFPDAPSFDGKIIWSADHFVSPAETADWFCRGALAVVSSFLPGEYVGKTGYEALQHSCQWCNYGLPFWPTENSPAGFSLSPDQARRLLEVLNLEGKLVLHAQVQAKMTEGVLPLVTGLLPGETDEEILITGHLFEQGANDNASGVAMALAIARELSSRRHHRGIRLMFTHEFKSLQAYLNTVHDLPHLTAGINLDMVGVSTDRKVMVGDAVPFFPNFAPCLLSSLIEKAGFTAEIHSITGMDTAFTDSRLGVPMTYMDLYGDPHYHKSSDTVDKLDPLVLNATWQMAYGYVAFLVDAGYDEAVSLIKLVCNYVRRFDAVPSKQMLHARLESIGRLLAGDEERRRFAKEIADIHISSVPSGNVPRRPDKAEQMRGIVPVKNFLGFFSFEKYLTRKTEFPEVAAFIRGWGADAWIDYALMLADGTRNALEI